MNTKTEELVEIAQVKDTLKQEFEMTLDQRAYRYMEIRPHGISPNTHCAAVFAESHNLYRDVIFMALFL